MIALWHHDWLAVDHGNGPTAADGDFVLVIARCAPSFIVMMNDAQVSLHGCCVSSLGFVGTLWRHPRCAFAVLDTWPLAPTHNAAGVLLRCDGTVWHHEGHRAAQPGRHFHIPGGTGWPPVGGWGPSMPTARPLCIHPPLGLTVLSAWGQWNSGEVAARCTRKQPARACLPALPLLFPWPLTDWAQEVVVGFHKAPKRWWDACTSEKGKQNLFK